MYEDECGAPELFSGGGKVGAPRILLLIRRTKYNIKSLFSYSPAAARCTVARRTVGGHGDADEGALTLARAAAQLTPVDEVGGSPGKMCPEALLALLSHVRPIVHETQVCFTRPSSLQGVWVTVRERP